MTTHSPQQRGEPEFIITPSPCGMTGRMHQTLFSVLLIGGNRAVFTTTLAEIVSGAQLTPRTVRRHIRKIEATGDIWSVQRAGGTLRFTLLGPVG